MEDIQLQEENELLLETYMVGFNDELDGKTVNIPAKHSVYSGFDNERLRKLLKEIKKIGDRDKPRYAKQSENMKVLFENEKTEYNHWLDQYSMVKLMIETEILHRVRTDIW